MGYVIVNVLNSLQILTKIITGKHMSNEFLAILAKIFLFSIRNEGRCC